MPFSSSKARAAFFEKLKLQKQGGTLAQYAPSPAKSLEANIMPKMPDINKFKLPKVSDSSSVPRFKKIKSFMKG
jgi:hypothetical protein